MRQGKAFCKLYRTVLKCEGSFEPRPWAHGVWLAPAPPRSQDFLPSVVMQDEGSGRLRL